MQCRHTVPDWHRFVDPAGDALPLFAACRLRVKEGERALDPRSIACTYWGHQRECPLFEGPDKSVRAESSSLEPSASRDVPVAMGTVWPVRGPGARDSMRIVLIGLGALSTALMLLTVGVGLLAGATSPVGFQRFVLAAVTVSVVTHVLSTLRTWAGR
jgi:hypothetical protein